MKQKKESGFFSGIISLIGSIFESKSKKTSFEEEIKLTFEEIVQNKNYPVQSFQVQTEDGYILKVFRIPGGKNEKDFQSKKKQAVLLQHGLLDSSDCWVTNHEKLAIAFILANAGFDVWLGNSRGNKYSRAHEKLSPESPQFWDFSFHEMAIYDLPAVLETILSNNTKTKKVIYIGHSQGGSMIFSGLSMKLDYLKEKLLCVVGLAPATRLDNLTSSAVKISNKIDLDEMLNQEGIFELMPHQKEMNKIQDLMIKLYPTLSYAMLEIASDKNSLVNCPERVKVYLYRFPAGASLRCAKHFKQIYNAKRFQYFDFEDPVKNKEKYGSEEIPIYDLSKISGIPIVICGGENDRLTHIEDIRWLKNEVSQTLFNYHEYKFMGHASFLISNDIVWFNDVLKDIYKIIEQNEEK